MRYRPSLDGVRALAVLAVIAFHVDVLPGGWVGVDVFFALSGWLITSILLSEHDRRGAIDLRAFYVRRLLRLMPALVVGVALAAVIAVIVGGNADHGGLDELAALTYTFDWYIPTTHTGSILGPTWSLAVEEQFYLLWPVALTLWLGRRRRPDRLAGWAAAGTLVASAVVTAAWGLRWVEFTPVGHAVELLAGAYVACRRPRVPAWLAPVVLLALAAVAALSPDGQRWAYLGGLALLGLGVAGLIQRLATGGGWLERALSWRPLVWLGRRSYGVYLYHLPLLYLINRYAGHGLRKPLIVAASIALAALSYRYVEQPFLRRKHAFERIPAAGRPDA